MRSPTTLFSVVCLVAWTFAPSALHPQVDPSVVEGFDSYIQATQAEWKVPGLAVAVVKDGEVIFAKGYGTRRASAEEPVDANTLFSIGSTTKAIAAAALGLLVDEGKLKWDDPVVDHLKSFKLKDPQWTRDIRIRDLLTHTAGLPNTDVLWYEQQRSTEEILGQLHLVERAYPVRSSFIYQNVMYATAGELTEEVSGVPWGQFVEQRIFSPLGMARSVASLARLSDRNNFASPHWLRDGAPVEIENASVDTVPAAGAIWSSVSEMAEWERFLLEGCVTRDGTQLLASKTCAELFRPQVIVDKEMYPSLRLVDPKWFTYGLGWFQTDYFGRALDFHSGSIDGLVALAGLVRKERLGFIFLGNLDHAEVRHALLYRALDVFGPSGGEAPRDWNAELVALFEELRSPAESEPSAGSEPEDEQGGSLAEGDMAARNTAARDTAEQAATEPDAGQLVGVYEHPYLGQLAVKAAANSDGLRLQFGLQEGNVAPAPENRWEVAWDAWWRGTAKFRFLAPAGDGQGSGTGNRTARIQFQGAEFVRTSP